MEIIFASGNKGKVKEVKDLFADTQFTIISLDELKDVPEIIEDGNTYEENARKKAETIYNVFKQPVIADDSGLNVNQLNGEPGVYSARYAGEGCTYDDNNRKLLKELSGYPEPHIAEFICCAVYYDGKNYFSVLGKLPGRIINDLRGHQGFGYDPIFLPQGYEKTLAELSLPEKNKISHRSKAFNSLKNKIYQEVKL
jgi:XTP/dITP diphosphohydrolase